jgi:iron(III) transport system ATP-binding protein
VSELEITGLDKSYRTQSVLRGLDLAVDQGDFVSILGPSGSGKTTLLRVIAGFDRADGGTVRLYGGVVDDAHHFVAPENRRIGYVPQDGSLFPHLSVEANVGFGLPRGERHGARVAELLEMVGLSGLARRYPHQLSGGQQQRVALARGLAVNPRLVLFDEPFSSLDASLRATLRRDVRRILDHAGTTAVLVTHDQDEALSLADRVAVIRHGRICQFDTPARLYARPATPELAHQFGEVNFLEGTARGGLVDTPLGRLALDEPVAEGTAVTLMVRPEQVVVDGGCAAANANALVLDTEFYGHDAVVKLRADHDATGVVVARLSNPSPLPERGARVALEVRGAVVAWRRAMDADTDKSM